MDFIEYRFLGCFTIEQRRMTRSKVASIGSSYYRKHYIKVNLVIYSLEFQFNFQTVPAKKWRSVSNKPFWNFPIAIKVWSCPISMV